MQLKQGKQLQQGKYTIQRTLGQGGFGITYLATTADGNEVAVKEFFMKDACMRDTDSMRVTVPTEGAKGDVERYRRKFIKEANNLLGLRHPNIVQVYEVFEENDTNYYVMQYMPGGSLRDLVMNNGPLPTDTARDYVLQVASALRYMHERKHLCHYDVKPGNILIDHEGQAMLIDFGLSNNYDGAGQQTSSTPVGISAGYAPIEQYRQSLQEFSPATDVYALGATLYFLLTGQNPPEASIVLEQGLQRTPLISDPLWDVVCRAMQPVRQQRYASMADMIRALDYVSGSVHQGDSAHQGASPATVLQSSSSVTPPPIGNANGQSAANDGGQPSANDGVYLASYDDDEPQSSRKTGLWVALGLLAAGMVVAAILLLGGKKSKSPSHSYDDYDYTEDNAEVVDTPVVAYPATYDEEPAEAAVDTMGYAGYYDDHEADYGEPENPIDVTIPMNWSGAFIIKGKRYPVKLSFFERYDYILNSSADYTNVNAGLHITMNASKNGSCYSFSGSDGTYPLQISVCETRPGHYEGSANGQFSATAVFDKN